MANYSRQNLVSDLAAKWNCQKAEVILRLHDIFEAVTDATAAHGSVEFAEFGEFNLEERPARMIETGIFTGMSKPHSKLTFKPGRKFKLRVQDIVGQKVK